MNQRNQTYKLLILYLQTDHFVVFQGCSINKSIVQGGRTGGCSGDWRELGVRVQTEMGRAAAE